MPTSGSPSVSDGANGAGLAVRDLEVRYGAATALSGVTLDVPPGARVAIVGRNGAGKSTLLQAIAGSVPVTRGRVVWNAVDITRRPVHARVAHGIALVPEASDEDAWRWGVFGQRPAAGPPATAPRD